MATERSDNLPKLCYLFVNGPLPVLESEPTLCSCWRWLMVVDRRPFLTPRPWEADERWWSLLMLDKWSRRLSPLSPRIEPTSVVIGELSRRLKCEVDLGKITHIGHSQKHVSTYNNYSKGSKIRIPNTCNGWVEQTGPRACLSPSSVNYWIWYLNSGLVS